MTRLLRHFLTFVSCVCHPSKIVHQGWFSEDFTTLFGNDELDELLAHNRSYIFFKELEGKVVFVMTAKLSTNYKAGSMTLNPSILKPVLVINNQLNCNPSCN